MVRSWMRLWSAALTATLLLSASASAAEKQTLVQFPVTIDVSMNVTVEETFESIEKCRPGENGSVSYNYDFESDKAGTKGKIGKAKLSLVNGEGGSVPSLGEAGGAIERGTPRGWEISFDDCDPDSDVVAPSGVSGPTCKTLNGRVKSYILLTPPAPVGDNELTDLALGDGKLVVTRSGGGTQNPTCQRLFQHTSPAAESDVTFGLGQSSLGTAGVMDTFEIALPRLGLSLAHLSSGKGRRFSQRFDVSGPCYAMTGKTGKATRSAAAQNSTGNVGPVLGVPRYETCVVKGAGVVIVTRRGKVLRQSFTV